MRELFGVLRMYSHITPSKADTFWIALTPGQLWEVNYWKNQIHQAIMPLSYHCSVTGFSCDASGVGWGGVCGELQVSGIFTLEETTQSSTLREILGLSLAFEEFKGRLLQRTDTPFQDNVTHIAKIRVSTDNWGVRSAMKWGSKNHKINSIAKELWNIALEKGFVWDVRWIPRFLNKAADHMSKHVGFSIVLNPHAVHLMYLCKRIQPTVQAFCTREGCVPQVSGFWHVTDPHGIHVDFMNHIWQPPCLPLATPAWRDLARVIAHVRDTRTRAILVCPIWYNADWWPLLLAITSWRWMPPQGTPTFIVLGSDQPTGNPQRLRYPSGFFMVDGALAHHRR